MRNQCDSICYQTVPDTMNVDLSSSLKTEWLTSKQAAEYLNISEKSLRNMTSSGKIPYYKLLRRNRYSLPELREFLLRNRRGGLYGL